MRNSVPLAHTLTTHEGNNTALSLKNTVSHLSYESSSEKYILNVRTLKQIQTHIPSSTQIDTAIRNGKKEIIYILEVY